MGLARAGFERGPWLAIPFAGGIAAWFVLDRPVEWVLALSASQLAAVGALALWRWNEGRTHLMSAIVTVGLLTASGQSVVWLRSELIGAEPLERPLSAVIEGRALERIEQPAEDRVRLVLATRDPAGDRVRGSGHRRLRSLAAAHLPAELAQGRPADAGGNRRPRDRA